MKRNERMFIIKLTDPQYNSYGYVWKDCIHCMGKHGFFYEVNVFRTEQDAEQHIQTCLNSGWYRPDITRDNFEIIEVHQHEGYGSAYYTDEYFKKFEGGE